MKVESVNCFGVLSHLVKTAASARKSYLNLTFSLRLQLAADCERQFLRSSASEPELFCFVELNLVFKTDCLNVYYQIDLRY